MGWLGYRASCYKNGKVDRKAEMDAKYNWEDESRKVEVLKSSMVGSTYYAAVKSFNKTNGYECVTAVVCLTSTNNKDYYNFAYKDMDETCGPYKYDCPKGILDLLTPTENEYANEWRKACYKNLAKKKNPNALCNLPEGSVIKVVLPFDTQRHKAGTEVTLTKTKWGRQCKWFTSNCYFTSGLMKSLEGHYEIVKRGEC
jgi:hypothetical protein